MQSDQLVIPQKKSTKLPKQSKGQKKQKVQREKLPKRTVVATVCILVLIPLTIAAGLFLFNDRNYYITSLIIIILSMMPFVMVFEGRKPRARELVIISVMVAIAVAGRAAFFMLPQFKPVVAIVIICGVTLGPESGFIVGALSGFVSNMILGQGPWTPWQMFAFGIIGFLAGILFSKGLLSQKRIALCIFGGIATFVIYGFLLDTAANMMFISAMTPESIIATYLTGIPFNLVHGTATIFFLAVLAKPMVEKLNRIKKKYGLVQVEDTEF
jgi:energy-coupling factor transport system substrate-specific component